MEEYNGTTLLPEDYEYENSEYENSEFLSDTKVYFIMHVATCIIVSIGLPLTLVTICALYFQVRKNHVAPIYIINLLITDFLQLCCMIVFELDFGTIEASNLFLVHHTYFCLLLTSIGFMVCVALERYLVITQPLWYRFSQTIKISVAVCIVVWVIVPAFYSAVVFLVSDTIFGIIMSIFLIIPFPLFIFFLVGTLRALSASISVSSEEKRRIVVILVLVLLIYVLLFLPSVIYLLVQIYTFQHNLGNLSIMFFKLSPLADLALYIFIRKDTVGKFLAAACCCKKESNDSNLPAVNENI